MVLMGLLTHQPQQRPSILEQEVPLTRFLILRVYLLIPPLPLTLTTITLTTTPISRLPLIIATTIRIPLLTPVLILIRRHLRRHSNKERYRQRVFRLRP